jgi:hypothetical protein
MVSRETSGRTHNVSDGGACVYIVSIKQYVLTLRVRTLGDEVVGVMLARAWGLACRHSTPRVTQLEHGD